MRACAQMTDQMFIAELLGHKLAGPDKLLDARAVRDKLDRGALHDVCPASPPVMQLLFRAVVQSPGPQPFASQLISLLSAAPVQWHPTSQGFLQALQELRYCAAAVPEEGASAQRAVDLTGSQRQQRRRLDVPDTWPWCNLAHLMRLLVGVAKACPLGFCQSSNPDDRGQLAVALLRLRLDPRLAGEGGWATLADHARSACAAFFGAPWPEEQVGGPALASNEDGRACPRWRSEHTIHHMLPALPRGACVQWRSVDTAVHRLFDGVWGAALPSHRAACRLLEHLPTPDTRCYALRGQVALKLIQRLAPYPTPTQVSGRPARLYPCPWSHSPPPPPPSLPQDPFMPPHSPPLCVAAAECRRARPVRRQRPHWPA